MVRAKELLRWGRRTEEEGETGRPKSVSGHRGAERGPRLWISRCRVGDTTIGTLFS